MVAAYLMLGAGWLIIKTEGDMLQALHVLAKDVGVMGVFSDWPATTTFYANCMNLR